MAPLFKNAHAVKFFIISIILGGISVLLLFYPTAAEKNGGEFSQQGIDAKKQGNHLEQKVNSEHLKTQEEKAQHVSGPLTVEVVLQRQYLDGEISEELLHETIWSMEDFWAQYRDWQLIDQQEGRMFFKQTVDDISPLLKADGYFGISEDGTLMIFKGIPTNSNEVIQSFFQIDISKLESRQQEELKNGIPVVSKEHYKQVIESFKTLSIKQ